ncbi:hypothetical protein LXL04_011434 [Taraxacum kok-saghyz]
MEYMEDWKRKEEVLGRQREGRRKKNNYSNKKPFKQSQLLYTHSPNKPANLAGLAPIPYQRHAVVDGCIGSPTKVKVNVKLPGEKGDSGSSEMRDLKAAKLERLESESGKLCCEMEQVGYPRDAPATVLFGEWFRFGKPSDQKFLFEKTQTGYILIFGTRFEYGYEIREEMSLNMTRESQNAPLRFRNRIEARTESKQ